MKKSKDVRRREILEAALRIFARKGYSAATMADITRESGLTRGGIYWHFSSKWEIFLEMFREHRRHNLALWERIEEIGLTPDALVEGGLLFMDELIASDWVANVFKEVEIEAIRREEIRGEYNSMYDEIRARISAQLARGVEAGLVRPLDTGSLAYALVSLVDGILTQYWLSGNKLNYRQIWRVTSAALIEGIRAPEERP
jgi:TetR/AcrR family acrAB operon transcriptional repressor